MINIVFFGECMIEESANEQFCFGGDCLNSALYCARVANKETLSVSFASAVGKDNESEKLLALWQQEGIDTRYVSQIANKKLGRYAITNNAQGERSFCYDRDDSAAKYYFCQDNNPLKAALVNNTIDYFYFSGISLAILSDDDCQQLLALLTQFKHQGGRIIFDNNYRAVLWKNRQPQHFYQQAMHLADIALLTDEDEYALYGGNSLESIIKRYPLYLTPSASVIKGTELVIKQGEKPCIIRAPLKDTSLFEIASSPIASKQVVDTCAAGDAFAAGYLAKRLLGESIEESAQFAHTLAGRVIQYSGAIIAREQMKDLLCNKA